MKDQKDINCSISIYKPLDKMKQFLCKISGEKEQYIFSDKLDKFVIVQYSKINPCLGFFVPKQIERCLQQSY